MALKKTRAAALSTVLILGGCSFATETLWPSLTGEAPAPAPLPAPQQTRIEIPPAPSELSTQPVLTPMPPPVLGTTDFVPPSITPGTPTGTFVGRKVVDLRQALSGLQVQITQRNSQLQQIRIITTENSQRYHGTIAAVSSRLQIGTTPGNPVLVSQWNSAQAELDRISTDIAAMNSLANLVANDSSMSAWLLESARATYGLAGAIDEDHRQLAILEDETNRTVVLIDRLLNELSEDISRQTTYVGNERRNLTVLSLAIKNGELFGPSLSNRAFVSAAPLASVAPAVSGSSFSVRTRRPLVVIRFDRPDVPFQQALYTAVSRAIERRPQAAFDLVAVSPGSGTPAQVAVNTTKTKRHAEAVLRTLTDMGLPADRVRLSSMTSPEAASAEVHIYMR
ncbi:MAG: hypothetical protein O7A68_10850 [Alphaproteobacteria bacterium]|nr:hypothetical protein [Alphaproteobacteria bacterium]